MQNQAGVDPEGSSCILPFTVLEGAILATSEEKKLDPQKRQNKRWKQASKQHSSIASVPAPAKFLSRLSSALTAFSEGL